MTKSYFKMVLTTLPPGVSEGRYLLYEGGIEDEEESDFISARML